MAAYCRSILAPQPQRSPPPQAVNNATAARAQRLAIQSKAGDVQATTDLTRQAFSDAAIPSTLADSFGFTDRIVKAETEYHKGQRGPRSEAAVIHAVNNLVAAIGAPKWAGTSPQEVRKLRMHLLVSNPQLFASQDAPDSAGRYKAVNEMMSPLEASSLAVALLFQKTVNPEYQFTEQEQAQNLSLTADTVRAAHTARTEQLGDPLQGKTQNLSIRDLLSASDRFFSDFGIAPGPGSQTVSMLQPSFQMGGRR